jgi:prepilin-type N-terminal cleavage/methylation domain-containing protein
MSRARSRLAREDGFTLMELMMASIVLAVGLLALVSGLDHSRQLVDRSEKIEIATHQAEEALERVLSKRYARVALTTTPVNSSNTADPRYYVSGTNYQWDQTSTGPQWEQMEIDSVNGDLVPSYAWEDSESRLNGTVHQFVTRTGDRCETVNCPSGVQHAKRVTVAVTVDGPRPLGRPVRLSTLMIDPAATGY